MAWLVRWLEKLNHNYPVLEFGSELLPVQVLLIRHKWCAGELVAEACVEGLGVY